jgi:hypothetical protein
MICAACRQTRDLEDLIVFWPIGRPEARRFVCRPTCGRQPGPCFYQVVGPITVHTIALAAPGATRLAPRESQPIVPTTPEWFGLLREAGVRSIAA